jgi:DNA invertase Pin-like site-specific DNA recombinase
MKPAEHDFCQTVQISKYPLRRPAFEELQRAIFDGTVETVVVWKLDRISRRLREGMNLLADWCERDVRVVSVT